MAEHTRNEIYISKLTELMDMALLRYAASDQQKLPTQIIYYRDGVANSQFEQVDVNDLIIESAQTKCKEGF